MHTLTRCHASHILIAVTRPWCPDEQAVLKGASKPALALLAPSSLGADITVMSIAL